MSRSYRHNPIVKDGGRSKKKDRSFANRKLRRTSLEEVANGGHYKKFTCQYDICDYSFSYTLSEWLERWGAFYHFMELNDLGGENYYGNTIQDAIKQWKKFYFYK